MRRKRLGLLVLLILLIAVIWLLWPRRTGDEIILEKPPSATVNQDIRVTLRVNVKEKINAGEFNFTFPKDLLTVTSIDKTGSFYELWIKDSPSFSNESGTINIAGGLPTPGFSGNGVVATIVFHATNPGSGEIKLTQSRLLANDGNGTVVEATFKPITITVK